MKRTLRLFAVITAITTTAFFVSCGGDDDKKIKIDTDLNLEFTTSGTSVAESASAITVTLDFTAAPADVSVTANVSGTAVYDTDYTSSPAVASNTITLSIAEGDESASITFTPIDNDEVDGSRTVIIELAAATGIELGTNDTFTVTITDDETPKTITTIADLRAMYTDEAVLFTTDTYIQGVVISDFGVSGDQRFTIQDATAGIEVRLTDEQAHALDRGDEVEINIVGAALDQSYFSLLQVTGDPDNDDEYESTLNASAITDNGAGTLPTPTTITISELEAGDHESELVTIEDVTFPEADGETVYSDENSHTIAVGEATSLYRANDTSFEDDLVPFGTGDVTGIASIFFDRQLIAQVDGDQFANAPTTTIEVTSNGSNDFGSVETNSTSSSQTYNVEVTGVGTMVTITASNGFEVSLNNESYGSEVVLDLTPPGIEGVESNLYARFAPTSGVAGTIDGSITFSAEGALSQTVAVTGVETVAVPPIFTETFETDGNGSRYTTSHTEHSDGSADFFGRVAADGIAHGSFIEYLGASGAYFAMMDTDGEAEGGNPVSITFSNIDITGYSNLEFAISLAEDDDGSNQDWDMIDNLQITASIDGGTAQNLIWIENDDTEFNAAPLLDTDFDGVGDGTEITSTFTEFTKAITGTGSSITITITANNLTAGDEDIAFDNIKITGDVNP